MAKTVAFRIEAQPTFRDLQGRFAKAGKELLDARRDEMRAEGPILVGIARDLLEKKIRRKGGMGEAIRWRTYEKGDAIQLSVTGPERAKPHRIAARNASALSFFWPKIGMRVVVPKRGGFKTHVRKGARGETLWIGKGHVDHPGGSLVNLMQPIMLAAGDKWLRDRGEVVMARISKRFVSSLTNE